MPLIDTADLSLREPLSGWTGRFFHSRNMTFGYWNIAADAVPLHEHHHPNEEVWHVVEGRLAIVIDGIEHLAGPGFAAIVPPNHPHSARALTACRAIVVDHPVRSELPGDSY